MDKGLTTNNITKIKLVLLTALVGGFWGIFNGLLVSPIKLVFIVISFLYFLQFKLRKGLWTNMWQDKFITLFLICMFANFLACWLNRGQTIIQSLQTDEVKNMLMILFFYPLSKIKCNVKLIEKSIITLYFLFLICYFLQFFIFYPVPVFQMIGVNTESIVGFDSEHRFRLVSQMIGFIGYFYLLNNILVYKKCPKYYYLGVFLGFLFIFLLGFRGEVIATLIASLYMIIRVKGAGFKMIGGTIGFAIMIVLLIQIPAVQKQISNMMERQEEGQTFQNDDYIRNIQLYYFLNEHAINTSDFILGSGIPSYTSKYGKSWYRESTQKGSFGQNMTVGMYGWVDWGVVGLSWMIGIPMGLLLYSFIIFIILKKYEKNYLYISSLYLFFLLTSITTIEFYREGAYIYHAFILYLTSLLDYSKVVEQ